MTDYLTVAECWPFMPVRCYGGSHGIRDPDKTNQFGFDKLVPWLRSHVSH